MNITKNNIYISSIVLAFAAIFGVYFIYSDVNDAFVQKLTITTYCIFSINILLLAVFFRKKYKYTANKSKDSIGRRMINSFSNVAILPAFILSIFAAIFLNYGFKAWFHHKVKTAIINSESIARAYYEEHKNKIRADTLFIANEIDRTSYMFSNNKQYLKEHIESESIRRNLSEIIIIQSNEIVAKTSFSTINSISELPKNIFEECDNGEIPISTSLTSESVRAAVKLHNFFDSYIIAGSFIDQNVIKHVNLVNGAVTEYKQLIKNLSRFQYTLVIMFIGICITILIISTFYGMAFSKKIINPIFDLVDLTEKVKQGNLKVRSNIKRNDEIGVLSEAFNMMLDQIEKQRIELINTNDLLDEKSRFNEMVLSCLSAGVIVIDKNLYIQYINPAAAKILDISINNRDKITNIFPQIDINNPLSDPSIEMEYNEKNLAIKYLKFDDQFIITFDDITKLISAKRSSAWFDVARRIAHEIKNPLTPIILSAERIKKKFGSTSEEKEMLNRYTNTIANNVESIKNMINEFVDFARIPSPKFSPCSIIEIINNAIILEKLRDENAVFNILYEFKDLEIECDNNQIFRSLVNIISNSIEICQESSIIPKIDIIATKSDNNVIIKIIDNGPGFSKNIIGKIAEPYVTTKANGTGLGLAIVKKIVEDHNGRIIFENKDADNGAIVTIMLPISRL